MHLLFFSVFLGPLYCHGSSGVDVHTIWPSPELQTSSDGFTGSVCLQSFLNGVSLTRSYSSFSIKQMDQAAQAAVALLGHRAALWAVKTDVTLLGWVLSFLYLQVVHPHLPLGQLDRSVGEGGTDKCYRSLLAVSVRHAGPQQLSLNFTPWH